MPFLVEKDIVFSPAQIGLLRSDAVVLDSNLVSHFLKQFGHCSKAPGIIPTIDKVSYRIHWAGDKVLLEYTG